MQLRTLAGSGRIRWAIGGVALLAALLLLGLAAFPWGMLKGMIERRASDAIGVPVTIGALERADSLSFTPTVILRDVHAPQAAWASGAPLARVDTARITFSAWPMLLGRFRPLAIDVRGLRMTLVRDASGRENWRKDPARPSEGGAPSLRGLHLSDAVIEYRDAKRDRAFTVRVEADSAKGLRIAGTGTILGQPVRIAAQGPAIENAQGKPWPFSALIDGAAIRFAARGTMDAPLDTHRMTLDIEARADDLKLIDAIIEAGLIGTQQVRITGHARRDGPDWNVTRVAGTIGRSSLAGHVTVRKRDSRTRLDGAVVFDKLLFDDLASDRGLAEAAAKAREIGPRIVPDTRINIRKIDHTDGTIDVTVRRLLPGKRPSALSSMHGHVTLDHQLLTVSQLRIGLTHGAITGSVRVDQRGGRAVPTVGFDLRLQDSSIGTLAGGGTIYGRLDGRVRVTGAGSTIREAFGHGDGTIGLAGRAGSLPGKAAAMLGFDLGGSLLTGDEDRAALRCLILRLDMRRGTGTVAPLIVDTSRSQARGTGTVRFPDEAIAIRITGAPKGDALIRLPGSATISGTIRDPHFAAAPHTKSVGNILKGLGRTITGHQGPRATDADCDALSAQALR